MKIWQDPEHDGKYILGTSDVEKLEILKPILGGSKIRGKMQISFPKRAAQKIWNYFPDLEIGCSNQIQQEIETIINRRKLRKKNIKKIKDQYKNDDIKFDYDTSRMKYPPGKHQMIMYNIIRYSNCSGLFADAGTQKTGPYLWAIDDLMRVGKVKKALIITLSGLKKNVLKEMNEVQIPHRTGVVLNGSKHADKVINKKFKSKAHNKDYDIYIANYEGMASMCKIIPEGYFDLVLCDEAHRIGDPTTQQSKAILEFFYNVTYKYIVSGSINANSIMSHHTPLRFLGEDNVKIVNYQAAKDRYMEEKAQYIWKERPGFRDEVATLIGEVGVEYKKRDCMDLPGVLTIQRTIPMKTEQKRMTDELKKDFITELKDMCDNCLSKHNCDNSCESELNGINALVIMGKLQQIANGYVQRTLKSIDEETGKTVEKRILIDIKENPKLDLLDAVLDEIGDNKVIIWSNQIPSLENLYKYLNNKKQYKDKIVTCWGNKNAFNESERFRSKDKKIFLANPQKAGTGLNIQYSHYTINFDNSYSFTEYDQKIGRQDRGGQTEVVTVYNLFVEGSIDQVKWQKLEQKESLAFQLGKFARVSNTELQ